MPSKEALANIIYCLGMFIPLVVHYIEWTGVSTEHGMSWCNMDLPSKKLCSACSDGRRPAWWSCRTADRRLLGRESLHSPRGRQRGRDGRSWSGQMQGDTQTGNFTTPCNEGQLTLGGHTTTYNFTNQSRLSLQPICCRPTYNRELHVHVSKRIHYVQEHVVLPWTCYGM